jgi:hypothetical protein
MGTGEDSQNSILKGILQNGASFNYPGSFNYQTYTVILSTIAVVNY